MNTGKNYDLDRYVGRLLKQVDKEHSITMSGAKFVNSMLDELMALFVNQLRAVSDKSVAKTIMFRDAMLAVRLMPPIASNAAQLFQIAVDNGNQAISNFKTYQDRKSIRDQGVAQSRSIQAKCTLSVSRVERKLKRLHRASRWSKLTSIFLTGVLDFLTMEILKVGCFVADLHKRIRLTPILIHEGVVRYSQLSQILSNVVVPRKPGMRTNTGQQNLTSKKSRSNRPKQPRKQRQNSESSTRKRGKSNSTKTRVTPSVSTSQQPPETRTRQRNSLKSAQKPVGRKQPARTPKRTANAQQSAAAVPKTGVRTRSMKKRSQA